MSSDMRFRAEGMLNSIGFGVGNGERQWIDELTSIIGRKNVEILVAESLEIQGSVIAQVSKDGVVGVSGAKVFSQLAKKFSFKDWGEFKNYAGSKFLSKVQKDMGLKENLLARESIKQPKYSNDPFTEATMSGVHSGQYKKFLEQDVKQLEKSIRSFEKNIAKHEEYIRNPKSHEPNWDAFSAEHQKRELNHWKNDIARAKEHKHIAEQVLKSK